MNITNDIVTEYINGFYRPLTPKLGELRLKAESEKVPIILKETETFLRNELEIIRPEKILEIGCAVGYSAMFFNEVTGADVVTVEKDENRFKEAVDNISALGYSSNITVLLGDGEEALNKYMEKNKIKFDLVFIDAAKSHYKRFLDASLKALKKDSVIIADNVLFRAMACSDEYDPTGKHKTNIRKLREFNQYIMNDERFVSTIIAVGDGISISKLK